MPYTKYEVSYTYICVYFEDCCTRLYVVLRIWYCCRKYCCCTFCIYISSIYTARCVIPGTLYREQGDGPPPWACCVSSHIPDQLCLCLLYTLPTFVLLLYTTSAKQVCGGGWGVERGPCVASCVCIIPARPHDTFNPTDLLISERNKCSEYCCTAAHRMQSSVLYKVKIYGFKQQSTFSFVWRVYHII